MKSIIIIMLAIFCSVAFIGCEGLLTGETNRSRTIVVVDQTLSTRTLRSNESVARLLKALKSRPDFHVELYGMMPDRIYPCTVEQALTDSYGIDESGNFTGGDLQQVITRFDQDSITKVILITDAENNLGNTEDKIPVFQNPDRFYLVGIRPALWQAYSETGVHAYTEAQVDGLVEDLVIKGSI